MQMSLTREITLVAIISHWSLAMRTPFILKLVLTEKESKEDTRAPESKRKCPGAITQEEWEKWQLWPSLPSSLSPELAFIINMWFKHVG